VFRRGDLVKRRNPNLRAAKADEIYTYPYEIVEVLPGSHATYVIAPRTRRPIKKVAGRKLDRK